jgi:hypothetical protein
MNDAQRSLAELARAQGLAAAGRLIEKFHTPDLFAKEFPADVRLTQPPNVEALEVIGQMSRRGLHRDLVQPLLQYLAERPLERGLLAWDAISSTLVRDGGFLDELRAAAAPYKDVVPAPARSCIDLNAHPAESIIPGGYEDKQELVLLALVNEHSLSALAELRRRKDPLVDKSGTHTSMQMVGRLWHLAHAPTLAAVYLDYLARALGFRAAARDLCEVMLDVAAAARLPENAVQPGDLPPELISDWAEYVTYRSYLTAVPPQQLFELMEQNRKKRPPKMAAPSVQLQLVRAHVCAMLKKPGPLSLEALDQICETHKSWRYASRVRVAVASQVMPPRSPKPLAMVHHYVTGFGVDLHTLYEALMVGAADASWKQELLPMLVREAHGLPHEVGVWRAIIMMLAGDRASMSEAMQEITRRIEQQSRL